MKKINTAIRLLVLSTLGATATSHANITFTFESANGGTQTTFATSGGSVNLGSSPQSSTFNAGDEFGMGPGSVPYVYFLSGPTLNPSDTRVDTLTLSSGAIEDVFTPTTDLSDSTAGIPVPIAGAEVFEIGIDSSSFINGGNTSGAGAPTFVTLGVFSTDLDIPFSEFGALGNSVTFMTEGAGTGFGNEITFEIIPEPSTVSLIGLCGLAGVMVKRYRTRTNKKDVIPSEGMLEKW